MRVVLGIVALLGLGAGSVRAQDVGNCSRGTARALLDVGNVRAAVYNRGNLFWEGAGNVYTVPKNGFANAIFASGILIGGMSGGRLRFAGSNYGPFEFWPGPLDEQGRPPADCSRYDRIFEISRDDFQRYELTGEATDDLVEWPSDLGAPVVDGDGIAGNYSLSGGDRPELLGDQMLWWVMNDLGNEHGDSGREFTGRPLPLPIAMEIQATAFAFSSSTQLEMLTGTSRGHLEKLRDVLRHATFYRFRLVYEGKEPLQDAYFGMFSDADLGNASDDFVGSDSVLGLAYVYNGDDFDDGRDGYQDRPPALGYDILRGPVLDPDDIDNDHDNLVDEEGERGGMTGFLVNWSDNTAAGNPRGGQEMYNFLRGRWRDGKPMTYGGSGYGGKSPAKFMFSGHPPAFWSEENFDRRGTRQTPSDRVFWFSTGPFTMDPGETEEVYVGIFWAQGQNRFDSLYRMKSESAVVQSIFDQLIRPVLPEVSPPMPTDYALAHNFPNPFTDRTTISYALPRREQVRLIVYDILGRAVESLVDDMQSPGFHEVTFEAGDLPPGVYFYELEAGPVRGAQMMVIAR